MTSTTSPRTPPRWLAPALGLWTFIAAVALANATAVPVSIGVVTLVLGALALGHGLVHRRWLIAGPFAVLALATTGAVAFDLLPADVDTTYTGPAGTSAPKLIWIAATMVVALEIAWTLFLHARIRRAVGDPEDSEVRGMRVLAERQAETEARLSRDLGDLKHRVAHMEKLLTDVD